MGERTDGDRQVHWWQRIREIQSQGVRGPLVPVRQYPIPIRG